MKTKRPYLIVVLSIMLVACLAIFCACEDITAFFEGIFPTETSVTVDTSDAPDSTEPEQSAHTHSYTVVATTQPTCETAGSKTYACSCGHTFTETLDALGHDWGVWTVTKEPGCETTGTKTRTCSRDHNHVETYVVAATDHDYEFSNYVWNDDYTAKAKFVCTHDELHVKYENAVVTNEITVKPTCDTPGVRTYSVAEGVSKTETVPALGHDYEVKVVDPTCIAQGYTLHSCKNCTTSYTDAYTAKTDHSWDNEEVTCTVGRTCSVCQTTEAALGHDYAVTETAADCTTALTRTCTCKRAGCNDTYTDVIGAPLGHNEVNADAVLVATDVPCQFVHGYVCATCGVTVTEGRPTEFMHSYVANVTSDPTCVATGTKTLTCSNPNCTATTTEAIAVDTINGHDWIQGETVGNIVNYSCDRCSETKTVIDASASTTANVSAADLSEAGEVKLEKASLSLDDTTMGLLDSDNVTLTADTLSGETLEEVKSTLDEQTLSQLGNSEIYNFTMLNGDQTITDFNGGKVTVTIPYDPGDEDVDSIAIWYISGGDLVSIEATYANNFVTFETEHFSYYTVTRLTPKERCALYGHNYASSEVAGSCTTDGYTMNICLRCGYSEKTVTSTAQGHSYVESVTAATCTTNGNILYVCEVCSHTYRRTLQATGHNWTLSETVAATCEESGSETYVCTRCESSYTTLYEPLRHDYVKTVVLPTCESAGYSEYTCLRCQNTYRDEMTAPLGHDYGVMWTWAEDHSAATAVFTCSNDETHNFTLTATVAATSLSASINNHGGTVYTASVVYNGDTYTDRYVMMNGAEHDFSGDWEYDGVYHWHTCICGVRSDRVEHTFELIDTTAATCVAYGEEVYKCLCGAEKRVSLAPTGVHNYVDGVCTVCGAEERPDGDCLHSRGGFDVTIDLSDYGFCKNYLALKRCYDCGKLFVLDVYTFFYAITLNSLNGDFEVLNSNESYENDYRYEEVTVRCKDCGMILHLYLGATKDFCGMTISCEMEILGDNDAVILSLNGLNVLENHNHSIGSVSDDNIPEELIERTFDLSGLNGCCGGQLKYYVCRYCGKVLDFEEDEQLTSSLNCKFEQFTDNYIDENGVFHQTGGMRCSVCGLTIVGEMLENVLDDHCYLRRNVLSFDIIYNSETLLSCDYNMNYSQNLDIEHDFTETVTLLGDSCTDGYVIKYTCENCGATYYEVGDDHVTRYNYIYLSDYGACDNAYISVRSCPCGEVVYEVYFRGCTINPPDSSSSWYDPGSYYESTTAYESATAGESTAAYDSYWQPEIPEEPTPYYHGPVMSSNRVYTDNDGITHKVVERTCTLCGLVYKTDSYTITDGCATYNYTIHSVKIGEFDESYTVCNADWNHDFEVSVVPSGDNYIISVICSCGESDEYIYTKPELIVSETAQLVDYNGTYYYDFEFTPDTTNIYTIESFSNSDTYVTLYARNGSALDQLSSNDDSENDCNFMLSYTLNAGTTYVYRIRFLSSSNSGSIPYTLVRGGGSSLGGHYGHSGGYSTNTVNLLAEGSASCEDGVFNVGYCTACGKILNLSVSYEHYKTQVNYNLADYGACDGRVRVYGCLCGSSIGDLNIGYINCSFNYSEDEYIDDNGVTHYLEVGTCRNCGLQRITDGYTITEGCQRSEYATIKIVIGDLVLVGESTYINWTHDFEVSVVPSGDNYIISVICSSCGESDEYIYTMPELIVSNTAQLDDHNGTYYYDFEFTPDTTNIYTIESFSNSDTYVTLYARNGSALDQLSSNDDSGNNSNFMLSYTLNAGITYVYRIRFYHSSNSGSIPYALVRGGGSSLNAGGHDGHSGGYSTNTVNLLAEGSTSCEDGVFNVRYCTVCGKILNLSVSYEHYMTQVNYNLADYGSACGGYIYVYECACGEVVSDYSTNFGGHNTYWTSNSYVDENGVDHYVEACTCNNCGLRFQTDSYYVYDDDNCMEYYYTAFTLNVGANLVVSGKRTTSEPNHDYEYSYVFDNGGTSCTDGVTIIMTCRRCEYTTSYHRNYHEQIEIERIALSDLGSDCGGYASLYSCPCGLYNSIYIDNADCDFNRSSLSLWIQDTVRSGDGTLNDSYYYSGAYMYSCAVTDPEPCGFRIRYAYYYLADAETCRVYQYQTWQFGYDPSIDTCLREITFRTGNYYTYHAEYSDRTTTTTENGLTTETLHRQCNVCGSYVETTKTYNADNDLIYDEYTRVNNLNNASDKYYHTLNDYTYVAPYGTNSYRYLEEYTYSDGSTYCNEYAYTHINGYEYIVYSYRNEYNNYYRHDYTYSFENGCTRTDTYNNNGTVTVTTNSCHKTSSNTNYSAYCTQDGVRTTRCYVCEQILSQTAVSPRGHNWVRISDGDYICSRCGLRNAVGVNGSVILEDMTEDNEDYYVVGYYNSTYVQFMYYVSLALHEAGEDGNDEVILDGITITAIRSPRAFTFSKAEVKAAAEALGYYEDDYDVRFTFVPVGADGSFDYAITLTDENKNYEVSEDGTIVVEVLPYKNTMIKLTCESAGTWTVTSVSDSDTYGYLYDDNKREILSNDDGGNNNNFRLSFNVKAGETYYIGVRYYNSSNSGFIPVSFTFTPAE